jgi:concanavalin A-like lectin/glucanase superfamily protein
MDSERKIWPALLFDGSNDRVVIPDSNSLDLTNRLTLEAWVYPTSAMSGWDTILMKEQTGQFVYTLYANGTNNRPYGDIYIGTEQEVSGTSVLPLNTWSHIALTYDGSTLTLYVNGQVVGSKTQTGSIMVSTGALTIGGNSVWPDECFAGRIDEIRIYNRALAQQEIQADLNTPIN